MKQAVDILRVLSDRLPDALLQDYFHEMAPGQIRKILEEAIKVLIPQEDKTSTPSLPAKLWQDKGKNWEGGLAGQTLQLYTDGASRGNPGEAGAGIAILDAQGNELVGTGKYLGQCTNNEAEYRALLFGLAKCSEFGGGRIMAYLDSELVVKQIQGHYKVKHPNLKPLFLEAMKKFKEFASVQVAHVRREKNSRADELANRAIDERGK